MIVSESEVGSWLTRQGCHWIFVEQSAFTVADGAKRAKPHQQIHRPDFIAMMDGFGTIAIDVKSYDFNSNKVRLEFEDENGNDTYYDLPVHWVRLAWEDICGLFEFQRVSNIPAWLCILNNQQMKESVWFRVDYLYESFSRIFISEELGFYDTASRVSLEYFPGWEDITLDFHKTIDRSRRTFQVLVENPSHVDIVGLNDNAQKVYVPPILIDLTANSSLRDLINIWPAKEIHPDSASERQMSYALAISGKLNISLPDVRDRRTISEFISKHEGAFKKSRGIS